MNKTLEKLWNEYFAEECATIDTKEEKALLKKAIETHDSMNELLQKEQIEVVEKYIDVIYEIQSFSVKKAFFYECDFAMSFILGARDFNK